MNKSSGSAKYIVGIIVVLLVFCYFGSIGNKNSDTSLKPVSTPSSTAGSTNTNSRNVIKPNTYTNTPIEREEPTYADPLWPTTNSELLTIPEADRWYNSWNKIGTYGTIAGPVAGVFQATDSPGMPVFVNIGNDYPSANRAQIIIWEERVSEFEDMLYQIDHGNAWVAVTGYIGEYGGVAQIDVNDGYTEWRWWTGVRN
jgi:hypothetical protein